MAAVQFKIAQLPYCSVISGLIIVLLLLGGIGGTKWMVYEYKPCSFQSRELLPLVKHMFEVHLLNLTPHTLVASKAVLTPFVLVLHTLHL